MFFLNIDKYPTRSTRLYTHAVQTLIIGRCSKRRILGNFKVVPQYYCDTTIVSNGDKDDSCTSITHWWFNRWVSYGVGYTYGSSSSSYKIFLARVLRGKQGKSKYIYYSKKFRITYYIIFVHTILNSRSYAWRERNCMKLSRQHQ